MLGFTVKDQISGFTGVVTAKTEWLNGCIRYGVQSRELNEGIPLKSQWFDEDDLVVLPGVDQVVLNAPLTEGATLSPTGGPRPMETG